VPENNLEDMEFDCRELVVKLPGGKMSAELTHLVSYATDEQFETCITVFRAARAFGKITNWSLNWHSEKISRRIYCAVFHAFLNACLRFCLLPLVILTFLIFCRRHFQHFFNVVANVLVKPANTPKDKAAIDQFKVKATQ
jgi:hypothetical protein